MNIKQAPLSSSEFDNQWLSYFAAISPIIASLADSGITANRPTTGIWIGRQYFDTTLGKPVYVKSVKPIVWVTATGVVA
jgi:hypothetical protein